MDEQPVALATIIRSPKSWETSLRYGVSPQPLQASENSNSGSRTWAPFTVSWAIRLRSSGGIDWKNSQLGRSMSRCASGCLLYTSDAADEEDSVDLGGRR